MSKILDILFKKAQVQPQGESMGSPAGGTPFSQQNTGTGPPRAHVNQPSPGGHGVGQPSAGNVPLSPAAPAAGTAPVGQTPEESAREQQVRSGIEALHKLVVQMAQSIYQMQLTDDQVRELATRMLTQLGEAVQDVTLERVKDIARDLLGEEDNRRRKKT